VAKSQLFNLIFFFSFFPFALVGLVERPPTAMGGFGHPILANLGWLNPPPRYLGPPRVNPPIFIFSLASWGWPNHRYFGLEDGSTTPWLVIGGMARTAPWPKWGNIWILIFFFFDKKKSLGIFFNLRGSKKHMYHL
jgi:hypothetical protein